MPSLMLLGTLCFAEPVLLTKEVVKGSLMLHLFNKEPKRQQKKAEHILRNPIARRAWSWALLCLELGPVCGQMGSCGCELHVELNPCWQMEEVACKITLD